jgi:hypothetical protein
MSLRLGGQILVPLGIALVIAAAGAVLVSYGMSWLEERSEQERAAETGPHGESSPYSAPGIRTPPVVQAVDADLKDDEPIIGIEVNGRYRAYREAAMSGMTAHVVNDLIGDIPVSVTYCDRANCARAFTDSQRGQPLDLWTGGMVDGNLALKLGETWIWQPTGETIFGDGSRKHPLSNFPIVRTSWKAWRELHPGTEVYIGPIGRPVQSKGLVHPPTAPAGNARLGDHEEVFGIEVNGHFRAYSKSAMAEIRQHVVNDLIGESPVTITYCPLTDCAQAFTTDRRGKALDIDLGGMQDGKMLLRHEEAWIWQSTGKPVFSTGPFKRALREYPLTRATWKCWRRAHPDGDVFLELDWRS